MKKTILIIFLIILFLGLTVAIQADLDGDINQLSKDIEALKNELNSKQVNYQKLNTQLQNIKTRVSYLENEILKKQKEVSQGEEVLGYQKTLLNERARNYYKNVNKNTVNLLNLLVSGNLSRSLDNFFYQKTVVDEDRKTIIKIVLYIKNLEDKKKVLEEEKNQLAVLKIEVDKQSEILSGEISQTQQKIATLTVQQQSLIAQKLASLNISRSAGSGAGGCIDDREIDPGFSPRFAFFTFGVPNRVGLNQYGAKGRADSGQDMETILRAYYNYDNLSDVDPNITIRVDGHSESHSLEDYVKRIYEMPADWSMEALKAQAVAARSYVLAYTNNGAGSICDSQSCQVYQDGEKGGRWNEAVEATRGKVMTRGGSPIKAWYSSTHGGYIFSTGEIGWSGTDWTKHGTDFNGSVGSFSDLQNNAYDKESRWFYCDWGARSEYSKTAWLKPQELADIVNVILLVRKNSSNACFVYQTDKPPPPPDPNKGCSKTDNWSADKVKQELGPGLFNSINDVSISADFGYGKTNSVNFSGDGGSVSIDGAEFKNWFNLRAPANIQIVGPLFNIEKK